MPYNGEKAQSYGYSTILENEFIKVRLNTYQLLAEVQEEFKDVPLVKATDLPSKYDASVFKRIIAVDGSVTQTDPLNKGYQVGAFKVASVTENLNKSRELRDEKFIDPEVRKGLHSEVLFTGLLPGNGIGHRDRLDRTWKDKYRLEFFSNLNYFKVPYTDSSFIQVLLKLIKARSIKCSACETEIILNQLNLKFPEAVIDSFKGYGKCPRCDRVVYITDLFCSDRELKYFDNSKVFLEAMSIIERILMAGLLDSSSDDELKENVFITDGPLGIFSSASWLSENLLHSLQTMKTWPVFFGLEKTGQLNALASYPELRDKLEPGMFAMIDRQLSSVISNSSNKDSSFYGKRFLYRTLDGAKVFALMVPPRVGKPYDSGNARADYWDTYPTLRVISEILEETATHEFGVDNASIDVIARANNSASLPKVLSTEFLTELVNATVE